MTVMVLASLLALTPLHPRPKVPPVGAEVDQSFEIPLPASVAGPTVSVVADGATIVISQALLQEIASKDGTSWSTEEERQTLIAAGRAKELVRKAAPGSPGPAVSLEAGALQDEGYLLAQILEAGKAVVVPAGSEVPARRIVVRYSGTHPGPTVGFGHIFFSLPKSSRVFFSISWFSS